MKSYLARKADVTRKWYVVDADGEVLGRLAVRIANVLRGRHRPTYTPHVDTGDFVVVTNAGKVRVTGRKEEQKRYMFHSGYIGNAKYRSVSFFRKKKPEFLLMHAVRGMLPKNRLARKQLTRLKVYVGSSHPHEAQQPMPLE